MHLAFSFNLWCAPGALNRPEGLLARGDEAIQLFQSIGTSGWQRQAFHATRRKELPKLTAELLVAVVQQVTATIERSGILHGGVARHLFHPACRPAIGFVPP